MAFACVLPVIPMTVGPAFAQATPASQSPEVRRPYRGLFNAPASPDSPHSLQFTGSVYAAYDDNIVAALANQDDSTPWLMSSGPYQGADAGLIYAFTKDSDRVRFVGQATGFLRYYRHDDNSELQPWTYGDVRFEGRLTKSLTFTARESFAYTSAYNSSLMPRVDEDFGHDIGTAEANDFDLFGLQTLRTTTSVGLTQRFSKNLSMDGAYHFRTSTIMDSSVDDSRFPNYNSHAASAGIGYSRPMTRHASLRLGYGIRVFDQRSATGEPEVLHSINAGVDYSRALSFSRRTFFSFGTGSAVAVGERLDDQAGRNSERRASARLTGHAALVHEIGRSWTANLEYSRGFRTRQGFDQLYFTDAVSASISGLISRRVSITGSWVWSTSSLDTEQNDRHQGQAAQAQATYAMNRFIAVFARYIYYKYQYDDAIVLDPRLARRLDRQGVRVGLTTSVPLIR